MAALVLLAGCGGGASKAERAPGGAGDERPARTVLVVTIEPGGISPVGLKAPAFIALRLVVHNTSAHRVHVRLAEAEPLRVEAGETGQADYAGLHPGDYRVDAGLAGAALLVIRTP